MQVRFSSRAALGATVAATALMLASPAQAALQDRDLDGARSSMRSTTPIWASRGCVMPM
jgi:hypothetical protein